MSPPPAVLALDIGSSSVRASLYAAGGVPVEGTSIARRRYRWRAPEPGAMEIPAESLVGYVVDVLDAAAASARAGSVEIAAVATAAFWHSLVGLDAGGDPITPVYGWGDARAGPAALRLAAEVDGAALHERTGCFLDPSYPAVKLAWIRERDPALFGRVAAWVSFPEYLEQRLFGNRRCSISMASGTGLLDVHRLQWDAGVLDGVGIAEDRLSPLVDANAPLRGLDPEWARRWPELERAVWFPALGDGACANVGSGAVGRARLGVTIGTSAAVRLVWPADAFQVPPRIWCYRLDARRWVAGRALSNGGNALAHLRATSALPSVLETEATVSAMGPDAHGLTVLPFLVPERGPGWRADREAVVAGLTGETGPLEVFRAWLEAIAYRIAIVAADLESAVGEASEIVASGGAVAAHPSWASILADVLGRPVRLPAESEATSRGAALVVQEELGWIESLDAAAPLPATEYEPDPARRARYIAAMHRQQALEAAVAGWSRRPDADPEP